MRERAVALWREVAAREQKIRESVQRKLQVASQATVYGTAYNQATQAGTSFRDNSGPGWGNGFLIGWALGFLMNSKR